MDEFKNKNITQMGLGLLGRGVGDVLFFLDAGANVLVTDKKTKEELAPSVAKLMEHPNAKTHLTLRLGGHRKQDFEKRDLVLFSAGIRPDNEFLRHAKKQGAKVTMSTALFAKKAKEKGATIIGITGTKGKSTVAHMIYHILKISSLAADRQVFLAGNIPGVSTLSLLPKIDNSSIVVLELDSWQLHGFGIEKVSPNIAVFTNFYPDHLNYYTDMEEYFADKANIYKYQQYINGDILFVGDNVDKKYFTKHEPPVEPIEAVPIPSSWKINLPGVFNRENAALAREACSQVGVPESEIKIALEQFKGVPGRLEFLGNFKEVAVYNDNNSTTPKSTSEAIKALSAENKKITLLAGGTDKNLPLDELAETIDKHCSEVFLVDESGSRKLTEHLSAPVKIYDDFEQAVKEALENARGGILLFSPAFSSFGKHFTNEYDREEKFKAFLQNAVEN